MSWIATGVIAVVSIGSAVYSQMEAAEEADRRRAAEMLGAKKAYSSAESSINIMKAATREATANTITDVRRAGAGQHRDVKDKATETESTLMAQSEGLTSGRSKGREMTAQIVDGNKALLSSKSEETSMINKLVDTQDKITNDLNNKLFSSWQQMATVLTTPGATYYQGNVGDVFSAGLSGASAGHSLGS